MKVPFVVGVPFDLFIPHSAGPLFYKKVPHAVANTSFIILGLAVSSLTTGWLGGLFGFSFSKPLLVADRVNVVFGIIVSRTTAGVFPEKLGRAPCIFPALVEG